MLKNLAGLVVKPELISGNIKLLLKVILVKLMHYEK